MNYLKSKTNLLMGCFALALGFATCNSGNTTSDVSDSATVYTTAPADSSVNSTDTSSSSAATDTSMKTADTSLNKKSTTGKTTSKKKGLASAGTIPEVKNHKIAMDKSGVYSYAEVMPKYPGGQSGIENYVTNNINYPETALDDGKEGRVSVAFTVDENGKVTDAHSVSNKVGDGLDEEAVRVVSSMHDWVPATVKGKPVKARVTLPITFRIEE